MSESTPVGIRIDTVTIWLDSTPIGAATRALGPRSALGRYDPGESLLVACYRIAKPGDSTYVLLKAGISDTGRVVHVLIARTPDTVDPGLRCASLPTSSARVSNSLGLHLGMTWNDVEGLLGKSSDTTNGKFARYAAYVLARIPDDTSDAGERRAQHAHVLVTLEFRGDTLDMIRIRRGKPVPGSATE